MLLECLDLNVEAFFACSLSTVACDFVTVKDSPVFFFFNEISAHNSKLQLIVGHLEVLGNNAQRYRCLNNGRMFVNA